MFTHDTARPAAPALAVGLSAATLVETASGWRAAGDLARGDRVQTFDGGLRALAGIDRRWLAAGAPLVRVPGGAFDACDEVLLPCDQHLLIDTEGDALLPDAAFVLVPALALAGFRGAAVLRAPAPAEIVTPFLAEAEAVWAQTGLLAYCPAMAEGPGALPDERAFTRLDVIEARAFLRRLCGADDADALRRAA